MIYAKPFAGEIAGLSGWVGLKPCANKSPQNTLGLLTYG